MAVCGAGVKLDARGGDGSLEFYPPVGFRRQSGSAIHEQGNPGQRGRASGVRGRGVRSAPLRFVSAASLFDGHDAAINMIRRLLQAQGAEVVHLGHNRSVADIVRAAIQEDADGIAVSSYQGGHNEYFAYMVDMLREQGCEHIRVVVGGGGTIAPARDRGAGAARRREDLHAGGRPAHGPRRHDRGRDPARARGAQAGLRVRPAERAGSPRTSRAPSPCSKAPPARRRRPSRFARAVARSRNTGAGHRHHRHGRRGQVEPHRRAAARFVRHFPERRSPWSRWIPTRRRSGGALLGDRIRMNSLANEQIFMRSLATRRQHLATSAVLKDVIELYKLAGFDLIIVETAGIGQSDTEIVDLVRSVAVRDDQRVRRGEPAREDRHARLRRPDRAQQGREARRGGLAARRAQAVAAQSSGPHAGRATSRRAGVSDHREPLQRSRASIACSPRSARRSRKKTSARLVAVGDVGPTELTARDPLIPGSRVRYLAEIAQSGRAANARVEEQAQAASARARALRIAEGAARCARCRRRSIDIPAMRLTDAGGGCDAARAARRIQRCAR